MANKTQMQLQKLRQIIRRKESAIKYLSQCILRRSMKGDPCIDLIEEHNKRERELNACYVKWVELTNSDIEVC